MSNDNRQKYQVASQASPWPSPTGESPSIKIKLELRCPALKLKPSQGKYRPGSRPCCPGAFCRPRATARPPWPPPRPPSISPSPAPCRRSAAAGERGPGLAPGRGGRHGGARGGRGAGRRGRGPLLRRRAQAAAGAGRGRGPGRRAGPAEPGLLLRAAGPDPQGRQGARLICNLTAAHAHCRDACPQHGA